MRTHHPRVAASTVKHIESAIRDLGDSVARVPDDVIYPQRLDCEPVEHLPLYRDAFKCTGQTGSGNPCRYVCRTLTGMQRHCRSVHQWINQRKRGGNVREQATRQYAIMWESCAFCQKFFTYSQWLRFFEVGKPQPPSQSNRLSHNTRWEAEKALRSEKELLSEQIFLTLDSKEEAYRQSTRTVANSVHIGPNPSPWLEMTRWPRYLDGHSFDTVTPLIHLPDPVLEPLLFCLTESLDRIVEQAYNSICQDRINVFDQTRINSFMQRPRVFDRPLMVKLQKSSFRQYKGLWKRLICFVCRSAMPEQPVQLMHRLTSRQTTSLDRLLLKGQAVMLAEQQQHHVLPTGSLQCRSEDVAHAEEELDRECLVFCISLLDHTLKGDLFESAVVGFLAVLGVDNEKSVFMEAVAFTPALSRFIKISQMLVAQRAVVAVDEGEVDDPCELLDDMRDRFLIHGSRSPFSWACQLRVYGRKVRDSTTCLGYISWSDNRETVSYKALELSMTQFKLFVADMVRTGQELLTRLFMLHPDEQREDVVPQLRLLRIKDNAAENDRGWSFLKDPRNKSELPDGRRWLMARVLDSDWLRDEFVQAKGVDKRPRWTEDAAQDYTQKVNRFLDILLLLIHITSGQPARGTETLSLRYANTMHHRNIFIEDGLVGTVTTYHKGYSVTGSTKIIHRYLPREVSELVVYYLWLIMPFCQALGALVHNGPLTPSEYLWDNPTKCRDSARLTTVLKHETSRCFNTALNIATYRHISIAISRVHLKCGGFKRDYGTENSAKDLQSAHGSWTAGAIYARGLEEAPGHIQSRRAEYRAVSREWHSFLGFQTGLGACKQPLEEDGGNDRPNRGGLRRDTWQF